MRRCKRACGIGDPRVSSQQKSLATAATEIFSAPVATAARFVHPLFAAEALKRGRFAPDPSRAFSRTFSTAFRAGLPLHGRAILSCRIDEHQSSSPASHAGLRIFRVIIGNNRIDADASGKAFSVGGHNVTAFSNCARVGNKRRAVGQRPSVILRMRDLDTLRGRVVSMNAIISSR